MYQDGHVIREETVTARKEYDCDLCWLMLDMHLFYEFMNRYKKGSKERLAMEKALNNDFKIKKGDKYVKQTIVSDGSIYCSKTMIYVDFLRNSFIEYIR